MADQSRDSFDDLRAAVAAVPAGRWAVGVSGGADSVSLLRLLHERADLHLHVVHINHHWRGDESDADAAFTQALTLQLRLRCTVLSAKVLEGDATRSGGLEARGRAARNEAFLRVVNQEALDGVLLAHHADDQAETILLRLLRGASIWPLAGIRSAAVVTGVRRLRPLLSCRRGRLIDYLLSIEQPWRNDSSNASPAFARNRVRKLLLRHPGVGERCLELSRAAQNWTDWVASIAPKLNTKFPVQLLRDAPTPAAGFALVQWLIDHGAPPADCTSAVADRLLQMCRDSAAPARQHFPGAIEVLRRRGVISARPVA